ncbi:cell adhesion molecule Dscam2-like [Macrosteles quadrilineatus]|uniref:cell adhesion molecule Dscam2-like n=1 Tax=Macrosteles quadrilineatus TaxID=74068 RepID=UPI0023E0C987|nr:cell adhesion molecule Dscam2-like [Macrosteles quadrilineatus]
MPFILGSKMSEEDGYIYLLPRIYLILSLFYSGGTSGLMDGQGPIFLVEPPSRVDFLNSTGGRLECAARGSPQPSIHWTLGDGSPLPTVSGLRYQLPNGTLVFPPFSNNEFRVDVHRTSYRCVASNSQGRIFSRQVRLRAIILQDYEVDVSSSTVSRGNIAVLHCIVPTFMRDYLTVTSWLQDHAFNIYPSSDGDGKFHMLPSGELVVLNVGQADGFSTYECRVTHRLTGETRVSVRHTRIQVSEPTKVSSPLFQDRDRLLTFDARKDELVILPCFAQGYPPPEYRWEWQDTPVSDNEHHYITGGGALLVIPSASVTAIT